jgi:hypothetical protein
MCRNVVWTHFAHDKLRLTGPWPTFCDYGNEIYCSIKGGEPIHQFSIY